MYQVELPPYYEPRSPFDLVAFEIVFGRMFEAIHLMLEAKPADVGASPTDDDKPPLKRNRRVPLAKKTSTPR
jgi:hypothetical protein